MSSCRVRSDMVETLFVPGKPMQHREREIHCWSPFLSSCFPGRATKEEEETYGGLTEESALLSDTYSYTG